MTSIDCYGNNLTTLDLSANVALTTINCRNNLLTSLNVSGLVNLNNLDFSDNLLTSVDVSSLAAVNYIGASGNQLTSIDVSNNLNLEDFAIYENPLLTSIDISANTSLVYLEAYDNPLLTRVNAANGNNEIIEIFDLRDNPSLTCITVDDVAYSTTNWTDIDVAASFSTDCRADNEITFNPIANQFLEIGTLTLSATSSSGLPVGFEVVSGPVSLAGNTLTFTDPGTVIVKATQPGDEDYKAAVPVEQSFDIILVTALPEQQGPQFKFYPNPVDRSLIVIPNGSNNYISLQDVQGRIVTKSESKSNEAILLDVSALPLGMYILRLSNEAGVSQTKILKK